MRLSRKILLALLGLILGVLWLGNGQVYGGPALPAAAPTGATLTNIAACLDQVRSHPDQAVGLRVEACLTLVDRERNLMVLQDDSAAMAVYTPLSGLALSPGQRLTIEGNAVQPYVRAFPAYPDQPAERNYLESFETPSGRGAYYLSRIRGYLHPPVSGQYIFWIAADDAGEFWLSPDASPDRSQRIALNKIGNATRAREWNRYPSQRSQSVTLLAGETYYVEALHVQSYGTDCLAVAWEGPGIERAVIDGRYLSPWAEAGATGAGVAAEGLPKRGLRQELWTNCFVREIDALRTQRRDESMVRIGSLKLTGAGAWAWPVPLRIEPEANLAAAPNLHWVELEGEVDFAAQSEGRIRFELKRGESVLGVRVLNWPAQPVDTLIHSRVRVRGVLVQSYGVRGELAHSVLWVPDRQQVDLIAPEADQPEPEQQVSICELQPSNPLMSWGRRLSVHGRIISRSTNGLVELEGAENYQAFCSANGTNWVALGLPVEIGMNHSMRVGLALASHTTMNQATARFTQVLGVETNWLGADIGNPGSPGSFSRRDGILTLRGGGKGIETRADQQFYLQQPLGEGAEISAQLIDLQQLSSPTPAGQAIRESLDNHAQAGLMIRESLDREAPYAAVLFSPVSGAVFQCRRTYGGESGGFEAKPEYRQYRWLKLVKRRSLLQLQGEPGALPGTNQEVEVTGMITWRNGRPILAEAAFQKARPARTLIQPVVRRTQRAASIAGFVAQAQHPDEPYLFRGMEGSGLTGIVTFCGDVLGQHIMFVQDGDEGAIRVGWPETNIKPAFEVGQLVELGGNSRVRQFPLVLQPLSTKVTGWGSLPAPLPYSAALVKSGRGQARWVEAMGSVRSEGPPGLFSVITKEGPLAVWVGRRQAGGETYVGALVRLRGVLSLDATHAAQLLVPSSDFVEVPERAPADPFAVPRFSLGALAGLDIPPERLRRMQSGGVVTCVLPKGVYIQDETGGAYLQTREPILVRPGDRVEAIGFPGNEGTPVRLSEVSIRKTGAGDRPLPVHISTSELGKKKLAGMLVSLEATLLEQRDTREAQRLTLQRGAQIFEAASVIHGTSRLPHIPAGSRVAITGVYEIDERGTRFEKLESEAASPIISVQIWLPTPADLVLLERASWWNLKRAGWLGGLCAGGFLVALSRVRLLRRRVAQQTRELQATMQQLEKETRTAAVLAERDRLAGEIHDSLEQGLTAIMLQLDAANKHAEPAADVRKFIHMARNMAEFSRAEVQHAVWDLQSPLLANASLGAALTHVSSLISSGASPVKVEIIGSPRVLPSNVEHHLLRIGQEAMTNAVKHALAKNIGVTLDYTGPDLILTIRDDGIGFSPEAVKQITQSGHFGLYGMRARANKIAAQIDVCSQLGAGTTITVRMKLNSERGEVSLSKTDPS